MYLYSTCSLNSILNIVSFDILIDTCILISGTRVEDAKAILAASPLRMFASDDLDQAAKMVNFSF